MSTSMNMDMESIRFSVIVPVYKVEDYLKQCVQSVLEQSFEGFELILVDDGSPDKCGKLCDAFSNKDNRIRVVHKPNGGLSSARNAGLDMAQGEYIIFLDSDDFWDDRNALKGIDSSLLESDADVLLFPAKRYYGENRKPSFIINTDVERDRIMGKEATEAIEYMIANNIYRAAAWNKVIRRSIIITQGMRFQEGYLSEDMDWCGNLLLHSCRFDFYNVPFYCYRQQRRGSITEGINEKLVSDKMYMIHKGMAQIESLDKRMGRLLGSYYAYEFAVTMGVSMGVKARETLNAMKATRELLRYDISTKVKKVNRLMRIIGFSLTRYVLIVFVKVKK